MSDSSERKIGFGLVGTGMAGLIHAQELRHVEGGELVAVCSRREDKCKAFAAEHGARNAYTDYEDLVRDPDVDVVCTLVPTGRHREVAIAAAQEGKHVVVEKPLEIDLERADEVIAVCKEQGVKLGVIFQMRFGDVARKLKQAVDSGAIGDIMLADAIDKSSRTREYYDSAAWRGTQELEGGGCLMTQSIHIVDLLQYIAGPVVSVVGRVGTRYHDIEVEDTATALVRFENGGLGVIESTSSVHPAMKSRLEIHADNGTIVANAQYDKFLVWG